MARPAREKENKTHEKEIDRRGGRVLYMHLPYIRRRVPKGRKYITRNQLNKEKEWPVAGKKEKKGE